jgi:CheY-like chemotaxis protein
VRMPTPRFLIVEDSPVVRLAIRQTLTSGGVADDAIFEAETASKAIERFDKEHPDVVFADITLPLGTPVRSGGDGFFGFLAASPSPLDGGLEAARYMMAKRPQLKLVVCSGNPPDDPRVRELVKAGAYHVLSKPLQPSELRRVLARLRDES